MVTLEGYPALAAPYEPREGFRATLDAWAARWRDGAPGMRRAAQAAATAAAAPVARVPPAASRADALVQRLLADAMRQADLLQGGFGAVAKHPAAPQLLALLDLPAARQGEPGEFLRTTLTQMQTQGLHVHLWGGFFRYTVDPGWREPHFEKMLVDNALLALLFLRAARVLAHPQRADVARNALAFIRRELRAAPGGGFGSGLSAQDDAGREGARYLWSRAELTSVLPPLGGALAWVTHVRALDRHVRRRAAG